jgi:hypothetical protein
VYLDVRVSLLRSYRIAGPGGLQLVVSSDAGD